MYFVVQGRVGNCGEDIIVDMKEGMVGPSYPQRKALEGGHVLSNPWFFNPLSVYFLFPCDAPEFSIPYRFISFFHAPEEIMYLYD